MWDLFNESGAVVNFHTGSGIRREETEAIRAARYAESPRPASGAAPSPSWNSFGPQRRLAVGATQVSMSNVRIIVNLCMSDLFDRYPRLQVVSAESGIGWIPFILESMEFQLDEMVTDPDEVVLQSRRPTEYFGDHIYVMFWFETYAPQTMLDHIGVERILVETDLPHPTCLYPSPRKHFAKVLSSVPRDTRRRILRDNAVELYHLDVP